MKTGSGRCSRRMPLTAGKFGVSTSSHMEFVDITAQVQEAVADSDAGDGLCTVFSPHTTAGMTINEGADPAVRKDLADSVTGLDQPETPAEAEKPEEETAKFEGYDQVIESYEKLKAEEDQNPNDRKKDPALEEKDDHAG